jgi:hypothetical protein
MKAGSGTSGLQPGYALQDRYRIEGELGRGGFGAVYRAWDTRLKKPCAVKENLEISPQAQRQFSREATVLASLTHPNLPRVTDHFSIEGKGQYLVMDFVEGEDLAALVGRQGRLPVDQALKWIREVADALVYLHRRKPPVVHRDIKPANIRITPEGRAVLVDFGLVKLYNPGLRTTIGARAITPGYAPPEQYGRGGSTDERTDIYALAATLYTLLTGKEPLESVQRLSGEKMQPAHKLNPQVAPYIGQAIERAMELDPVNRFQKAAAFKEALDEPVATMIVEPVRPAISSPDVAAGVPVQRSPAPARAQAAQVGVPSAPGRAPSAPARTPSRPAPKRNTGRIIMGVLAALLILCVGGGALVAWWLVASNDQANLDATERAVSVNQTATAFSNTLATKTAEAIDRSATQAAQTADAQAAAETATAQALATAQAATAQAQQAPLDQAKQWSALIVDSFNDNALEWATGERDGDFARINWIIDDGLYRWETYAYDGFVWWVTPDMDPVSDFYLAADMYIIDGPATAESGLIFWRTEENAYHVFEIDGGYFAVFYYDSSEWITLLDWAESPVINANPGETNRLAVIAQGEQLLFYINDQYVAELFNSEASSGSAGLIVGLDEAGEEGVWEFDNFELRTP